MVPTPILDSVQSLFYPSSYVGHFRNEDFDKIIQESHQILTQPYSWISSITPVKQSLQWWSHPHIEIHTTNISSLATQTAIYHFQNTSGGTNLGQPHHIISLGGVGGAPSPLDSPPNSPPDSPCGSSHEDSYDEEGNSSKHSSQRDRLLSLPPDMASSRGGNSNGNIPWLDHDVVAVPRLQHALPKHPKKLLRKFAKDFPDDHIKKFCLP